MYIWETIIKAIDPITGEMKTFGGPNIKAPNRQLAHEYCQTHGLGYCAIGDRILCEIPTKEDGVTPDWDRQIDYAQENCN